MITWGVTSGSHDGAISVFEGTNLLFASDAERFSKIKNDSDITCVSEYAESEYGVPDKIYFYENPYLKATRRWYARQKPYLKLPQLGRRGVSYTNHHYSHACYGYFTSPYEDCIVISMDAMGFYGYMACFW
jgi:carbamoyltransferase